MTLARYVALLAFALSLAPAQQTAAPDVRWLTDGNFTRFRWTARPVRPRLSPHQRLMLELEAKIDGAEIAQRQHRGSIVALAQISDDRGHPYLSDAAFDLKHANEDAKRAELTITFSAFVLPGDYHVMVGVRFTATGEHDVIDFPVRIAPLSSDPLPESWRGLPSVEFISALDPPASWYLPGINGRLKLAVEPPRPLRVEVVANLSPAERLAGSRSVQRRNMEQLLPSFKLLADLQSPTTEVNMTLLDLERRRAVFAQKNVDNLGWDGIEKALGESDPAKIDVGSLEHRGQSAQFFEHEIAHRIEREEPARGCAVIILSSMVTFNSSGDRKPLHPETPGHCQVFYLRFHRITDRERMLANLPPLHSGRRPRPHRPWGFGDGPLTEFDDLAPTLKELHPAIYDIESPDQFRKALAAIRETLVK